MGCPARFIGTLPPFLRYWSYATVFTVVLAGACVAGLERIARGSATALRHGMTALLAVGVLLCANGMRDEAASFDERRLGSWIFQDQEAQESLKSVDFWWIRAHDSWLLAPVLDEISQHGLTLVDVETGYQAAQLVMLNCLASLREEIGDLDRVTRIVKLLGMVNSAPDFGQQPEVINGASDLLVELYGERGRHAGRYIEVRICHSSGKNLSSRAFAR